MLTVPFEFNFIFGQKKNHFELGLGATVAQQYYKETYTDPIFYFRLGYRYQKPGKGLLYRIAFTPFSDYYVTNKWSDNLIQPFIGGSIGYAF